MSAPGNRIVAVDGPAASGKTTLARRLASHFGLDFLDTGLLYRAVARKLLEAGKPLTDIAGAVAAARVVGAADLNPATLRSDAIGQRSPLSDRSRHLWPRTDYRHAHAHQGRAEGAGDYRACDTASASHRSEERHRNENSKRH